MSNFTCFPNPAPPGSNVTICITPVPAPGAVTYADVTFFDNHGAAFIGIGLRFTGVEAVLHGAHPGRR